jgi:single-strand DNA-binding protein
MNEIQVSLRGNVASEPRHVRFDDGNTVTSFRLASTARRFDRERQEWVDRETTYVSVNCRRAMASNAATSVRKGHPVVVTGRLRERFWSANGRSGQSLEVEADMLGHDLSYGTTEFVRIVRAERIRSAEDKAGDELAYQLAEEAVADRPPVDVSGLTDLGDDVLDTEEAFEGAGVLGVRSLPEREAGADLDGIAEPATLRHDPVVA